MFESKTNIRAATKTAVPFEINPENHRFYTQIQSLLSSKLPPHSLIDDALDVPRPDESWDSMFHRAIVSDILEPNHNLMKMWTFTAWFFRYSNYASFKTQNQALNLAIKAIYHRTAPRDPNPNILAAIDQLLLDHIKKMHDSKLFSRKISNLYVCYARSLTTNIMIKCDEDTYKFEISDNYIKLIDEQKEKLLNEVIDLRKEKIVLQKGNDDYKFRLGSLEKKLDDFIRASTSPAVIEETALDERSTRTNP